MISRVLALLISTLLFSRTVVLAEDAECKGTDFEWAYNEQKQSPCKVANTLLGTCGGSPFAALDSSTPMWGGPGDDKNACLCSLVEYNLLRVCALCQKGATGYVQPFKEWATNCGAARKVEFPNPPPEGTTIPAWASKGDMDAAEWSLDAIKVDAPSSPSPSPTLSEEEKSSTNATPSLTPKEDGPKVESAETPSLTLSDKSTPTPSPSPSPSPSASPSPASESEAKAEPSNDPTPAIPSNKPEEHDKATPTPGAANLPSPPLASPQESDKETDSGNPSSAVKEDESSQHMSLTLPKAALLSQTPSASRSDRQSSGDSKTTTTTRKAKPVEASDGVESMHDGVATPPSDSSPSATPTDTPSPTSTDLLSSSPSSSAKDVESVMRKPDNPTESSSSSSLATNQQLAASTDPFSGVNATLTDAATEQAEQAGRVKIGIIAGSLAGAFLLIFLIFRFWTCSQYRKDLRDTIDPETFEKVLERPSQSTIWKNIRGGSFMPRRLAADPAGPRAGGSIWRNLRNSFMPHRRFDNDENVPPVPAIPAEYAQGPPPLPPKSLAALRNIPTALRAGSRRTSEDEEVIDNDDTQCGAAPNGSIPTINIEDTSDPQRLPAPQYDERDGERASWI